MRRLAALAVSVFALLVAPSAATAACPAADVPAASDPAGARAAVLCLTNEARTTRGLAALTAEARLDVAATRHVTDMVARSFFDHTTPEGGGPGGRIAAVGYAPAAWGENIALGQVTPRDVVLAWLGSEGHCRNLLSSQLTEVGLGVTALPGRSGAMWGQVFGRPSGTRAPAGPTPGCPETTIAGRRAPGDAPTATPVVTAPTATAPARPVVAARPAAKGRRLTRSTKRRGSRSPAARSGGARRSAHASALRPRLR